MIFCNRNNIPKSDPRPNNIKKVNDILPSNEGNIFGEMMIFVKVFFTTFFWVYVFFGFLGLCTFIGLKGKIK
jgi:hypothetical protein